jgi:PKD repeat protein
MFSSSSQKRIAIKGRRKPGKVILLAALLLILALLLPATMAANVSGTSANATTAGNTIPAVTSSTPVQTAVTITTSTAPPATPAVKAPKIEFTVNPVEGIAPLTVTIYPMNPAGGAADYLVIDFGDGQQLNETLKSSYQHTYQIAGNYSISLTSVNAGGSNVETLQSPVSVHIPVTVTSATPTVAPATTSNITTIAPVTSVTTPALNTTIVNTTNVTPVTGSGQNVTASDLPCFYPNMTEANFTATPVEGQAPLKVNFFDNSSCAPPVAWQWDFGSPVNPGIKTMRDPVMTYADPGTYNVSLRVINSFNNNSTKTVIGAIHVLPPVTPTPYPTVSPTPVPVPVIVPNFTANLVNGQAPLCVQFTESSTGSSAVTWFWDFGDSTNATVKNPSHCYNSSGNFTVTLKTAPAGGAPATKIRENYIIVSSGSASFPMDILFVIAIIIVILIVVGIFVMKRNGGSHHAHTGVHHDETMKSDQESSEYKGPRRGRDL